MPDHSKSNEDLGMYKSIFQNSLDAILLTKPDGSILSANPAAEEMFGMSHVEIVAAGRDGLLVHDQALKSAIKERKLKGRVKAVLNFKRKDESIFLGEVTSTLFKDEDGILKTNLIIRDITDHKLAEKALQESEDRFRSVLKNSQDVVYRFNLQNNCYEYMSPSIRSLGFEPEEMMAMSNEEVLSHVHPEDRPSLILELTKINKTGKGLSEYRFQGNDGHYRWWSNQMVIIKDSEGEPLYRDGFVREVTKAKQAEKTLRQSEKKFSKIFNANPAAITLSDAEGRWTDVMKVLLS
jgi:PAS domain S-box-containing protein